MRKHIFGFLAFLLVLIGIGGWYVTRPDVAQLSLDQVTGPKPEITEAREQMIPTVSVAEADRWKAGEAPAAAEGLVVERFAEGLDHPRNIYVLPNGDVLVAETNAPANRMKGIEGWIAAKLFAKAGAAVPSANRITLLRDADGDGKPEVKSVFLEGLNSPFGMALVGNILYVANTDAVLAFPYKEGDTKITAKGNKILELNAKAPNNHWTRNLAASADGKKLYIAVGSNSNIAENGLDQEIGRARVIELDLVTGKKRGVQLWPSQSGRARLG
jgi:glucose/arabinose dehydrogenase